MRSAEVTKRGIRSRIRCSSRAASVSAMLGPEPADAPHPRATRAHHRRITPLSGLDGARTHGPYPACWCLASRGEAVHLRTQRPLAADSRAAMNGSALDRFLAQTRSAAICSAAPFEPGQAPVAAPTGTPRCADSRQNPFLGAARSRREADAKCTHFSPDPRRLRIRRRPVSVHIVCDPEPETGTRSPRNGPGQSRVGTIPRHVTGTGAPPR